MIKEIIITSTLIISSLSFISLPKENGSKSTISDCAVDYFYFGRDHKIHALEFYGQVSVPETTKLIYTITLVENVRIIGEPTKTTTTTLETVTIIPPKKSNIYTKKLSNSYLITDAYGTHGYNAYINFEYSLIKANIVIESNLIRAYEMNSFYNYESTHFSDGVITTTYPVSYFDGKDLITTKNTGSVRYFNEFENGLSLLGLDFRKLAYDPLFRHHSSFEASIVFDDIYNLFPYLENSKPHKTLSTDTKEIMLSCILNPETSLYHFTFKDNVYVDVGSGQISQEYSNVFRNRVDYFVFPYREELIRDYSFNLRLWPTLSQNYVNIDINMNKVESKGIGNSYDDNHYLKMRFTSEAFNYLDIYEATK